MEPIHYFMNYVVAPILVIVMAVLSPIYLVFKLVDFIRRSLSSQNMYGKVVIITGASSGIGEQLAYEYAKRKACLTLVARRENCLEEVAKKARGIGSPDVIIVCADVSKLDDCKRFVQDTVNHFGRLDHLVNNAGTAYFKTFEMQTNLSNFETVMAVNFWGSIYATHFAIPHLKKTKGHILVNTSVYGWMYAQKLSSYGASKAALTNFFESMRVELGPEIKITIASPGAIESEMTKGKRLSDNGVEEVQQFKSAANKRVPVLKAEECAEALVKATCRGDRYVVVPSWYTLLYFIKLFFPDFLEFCSCSFLISKPKPKPNNFLHSPHIKPL